jgi:hypothetical protein
VESIFPALQEMTFNPIPRIYSKLHCPIERDWMILIHRSFLILLFGSFQAQG